VWHLGGTEGCNAHLGGRRQQHARVDSTGQPKHVERALRVGLDGLDWVVHVVWRRRGRCQVVDLIDLVFTINMRGAVVSNDEQAITSYGQCTRVWVAVEVGRF
jgi:hypothetical protein